MTGFPLPAALALLSASLLSLPTARAVILPWESITTTTVAGTASVDPATGRTFLNQSRLVTSFTAGGVTYDPVLGYKLNSFTFQANPGLTRVWYEQNSDSTPANPASFTGSPLTGLADMFSTPLQINYGSDDTFIKTLDSVVFSQRMGIQIASTEALSRTGISIIERGANDANFVLRLVTGVDASGAPTAFSSSYTVIANPFGTGVSGSLTVHTLYDSANTNGTGPFGTLVEENRAQVLGGTLITFDQFTGVTAGTTVFGYELSVAGTGARTGLDLLSGAAAFQQRGFPADLTPVTVPEPSTLVWLGLGLLATGRRRR